MVASECLTFVHEVMVWAVISDPLSSFSMSGLVGNYLIQY